MSTLQQKLAKLLKKIKEQSYPADQLKDMLELQKKIKSDIKADDSDEAMALLGYLLKNKYVKIESNDGIVLNPDKNEDIQILLNLK